MKSLFQAVLWVVSLLNTDFAVSHHSVAPLFDTSKEVSISGVVTRFSLGNPHMRIFFNVTENGATTEWMAEGGSRLVLLRKGWSEDELQAGDEITILGNPSRSNSPVIHLVYVTFPDGRELYGEDINNTVLEDRPRRQRED